MATTSALITVVNALWTQLSGDTAITALCTPYDGPPIVDRSSAVELWVGALGLDADDDSITLTRTLRAFGGGPAGALRDETISIPCAIWSIGGETTTVERRAQVAAVFAALCTNLSSGSGDLGLTTLLCGGIDVTEGRLRQLQTPDGYAVVLTATLTAQARI